MKAIILAAGVGHRMRNLTKYKNKAFFTVGTFVIIEHTLNYLLQAGIEDITIVTGHMHETFLPLQQKYPVKLLRNPDYARYNNIHSLELIAEDLSDSWLIHGDTVLYKNVFKQTFYQTTFYTVLKNPKGAPMRTPLLNEEHQMMDLVMRNGNERMLSLLGVSYWTKDGQQALIKALKQVNEKMRKAYSGEWEDVLQTVVKQAAVSAYQLDSKYGGDLNTMKDYQEIVELFDRYWKKEVRG